MKRKKQSGAAIAETIIVIPVFLLLSLGAIQMGLMYQAKSALNYAALLAARQGAMNGASVESIKNGLRAGLIPYMLPAIDGFTGNITNEGWTDATASALDDVRDYTQVTILNPTQEAFDQYGSPDACDPRVNDGGTDCIPNDNLFGRIRVTDGVSRITIQTANLLKVQVSYGFPLNVPVAGPIIAETVLLTNAWSPTERAMIENGRFPIMSVATVRMQSPAQRSTAVVTLAELNALY